MIFVPWGSFDPQSALHSILSTKTRQVKEALEHEDSLDIAAVTENINDVNEDKIKIKNTSNIQVLKNSFGKQRDTWGQIQCNTWFFICHNNKAELWRTD